MAIKWHVPMTGQNALLAHAFILCYIYIPDVIARQILKTLVSEAKKKNVEGI